MITAVFVCPLPGPSRKRTDALYRFRLIHLADQGCRQLWQCDGGRNLYQQALADTGEWTCTCPAYEYRKDGKPCKHLLALQLFTTGG